MRKNAHERAVLKKRIPKDHAIAKDQGDHPTGSYHAFDLKRENPKRFPTPTVHDCPRRIEREQQYIEGEYAGKQRYQNHEGHNPKKKFFNERGHHGDRKDRDTRQTMLVNFFWALERIHYTQHN